jgi:transposase
MARSTKKVSSARRRHSDEFKEQAIGLMERVGTKEAAAQLGVTEGHLYTWRRQAQRRADRSEAERQLATENARLKRQVAEQAEELAILKKAAAYFARSLK